MSAGKGWTWFGFGLGVAVSVAGNVAHTWHPSAAVLAAAGKTAAQWRPELGAQLVAGFFPVALLITVEVLARVVWPKSWGWSAARWGGAALVAGVAAVVSYLHLRGLMVAYGEDALTALIGPLSVDGLMVVCGFALIALGRVEPLDADEKGAQIVRTPGGERGTRIVGTPGLLVVDERGVEVDGGPEFATVNLTVANGRAVTEVPEGPRSGGEVSDAQSVVEDQAPDPAGFDQPDDQSAEGPTAGGGPFDAMGSAVRSARANGLPVKTIAETFGLTQYRVKKLLAGSEAP
ncbi:MAG: DUF2637 domain-containing protein [Streptosporangiaceae bacterium]